MNDNQLKDLKHFIDSRISQSEVRFEEKLHEKLVILRKEILDGFAGVGEAFEEINKQVDERLTKLEHQTT